MTDAEVIHTIAEEVRRRFESESSGHDWWHMYRVWKIAEHIGKTEKVDLFVVGLSALLHDIADWKFHDGDDTVGPQTAREILIKEGVSNAVVERVADIIGEVSFKGAGVSTKPMTLEGRVVQDADRLDALGAVGIARTFAYGGHKGRPMHDPLAAPVLHVSAKAYKASTSATINHFYEKLFLLKDQMNTATGRALAEERDAFMHEFVDRFLKEWEGGR